VTLVDGQPTASSGGTYTATITNPLNGCTRQLELTAIDLQGAPQITAGMVNALTCLASQQEVQGAGVTPFTPAGWGAALTPVIAWHNIATPGGIAPPTGGFNPVVAQAGTYVLTVTWLESGCSSTDTLTAVEGDDFGLDIASMAFPNVITPNGDQRNDTFRPYLRDLPDLEGLSVLDNYYLRVFDRWGVQVYNNTDGIAGGLPIRWPATNNAGDLLAAGTYWFVVDYRSSCGDRQEGHRQGWLSILVD
jgi:gliding motility-associated-like protein